MATIGNLVLTYADWAKRVDPDGKVATVVEILNQQNEVLEDMLVMECNDGTSHKTTTRTGIPSAAWRMLNYGVPRVKTTTAQVKDTTGMLESYSEVDKDLAKLSGDVAGFRLSEANGIMEGMNQQMATTLFYGNTNTNPDRFLGLAPRYSTILTANADSAENVIDGGGVGATNTSIWLVYWGANTVHGLFPKGSKAGLLHEDLGEDTLIDAVGGRYQGYRDHFKWDLGMSLRDWRYVVRIANVDVAAIIADATFAKLKALISLMIDAEEKIRVPGNGRPSWYMNRQVRALLRKAIIERMVGNLTEERIAGKRVTMFDGIPVRAVDALLNTEARIV